jgi:hypothetical protein
MKHKMKIKKHVDDSSLTWEERYKRLETHHLEETAELKSVISELECELDFFIGDEEYYCEYIVTDDFSDLT